jgi:toxin ParE1/3/4
VLLDIEEHASFIFRDNQEAGLRFPLACDATFERLLETPRIGRELRLSHASLSGSRQWPVQGFPNHLVFYIPHEGGIEVIRVLHGSRAIEVILVEEE